MKVRTKAPMFIDNMFVDRGLVIHVQPHHFSAQSMELLDEPQPVVNFPPQRISDRVRAFLTRRKNES